MNANNQYVWHCPGKDCRLKGIIILKTSSPYLGDGTIRCPVCYKEYSFQEIMRSNIKNIERYVHDSKSY